MKVLSHEIRLDGNLSIVVKDGNDELTFVYPADKFNNFNNLRKEIKKKILFEKKKKDKKNTRLQEIKDALDDKIASNEDL